MNRSIPLLLIGLIFGGGLGFAYAAANGITLDGHDHGAPAHHAGAATMSATHGGTHDHDTPLRLTAAEDNPRLEVEAVRDPASGWNLHIITRNFRFAPENASTAHVPGEGHAHVYVNGTKIGRYYGPWLHLARLPEGGAAVEVTLNANDHRPFVVDGTPVAARIELPR